MKTHILILNYNGAELLRRYLPSFVESLRRSSHQCRLSVVDNASRDDSEETTQTFPDVGWFRMKENKVLCSYNEVAERLDDEVLILMNNDIRVDKNWIDPLIKPFLTQDDVFMVTPRCLSGDGLQYEGNKTRARLHYGVFWSSSVYPGYEKDSVAPGLTFQGGFGAVDRKKFLELNGYDDLYLPGRLEDADICFRAYKKKWTCLYEPASVVYHEGGVSFQKRFGARKTLIINWRNTFLFMFKNLSDRTLWVRFCFWLPIRLARSLAMLRPELAIGFFQAIPMIPKAIERKKRLKHEGLLDSVDDQAIFRKV